MKAPACRIDLGDGSERGEYVEQDYILRRLGRPVHAINLMYCYYPNDEAWPQRASKAYADRDVKFAWDYPYDDYFPYLGGLHGNTDGEPFTSIRDVRRHGQDVVLTLTMDPLLPDEEIAAIARELRPFGRLQIRINHEATGNWFSFNKRADYPEVAAFFARCVDVFHREAPHIRVILCLDGYKDPDAEKMEKEDDFLPAILAADIESVDRYLALHWGWPFDVADSDTEQYARYEVKDIYALTKKSAARYRALCGVHKPMVLSELNADGDVTGPYEQAEMVREFASLIKADKERWLDGFTLYQFRDRGRLGLEFEDPNNPGVGVAWPLMDTFCDLIRDPFFSVSIEKGLSAETKEKMTAPAGDGCPGVLRWGGSDDADGIALPLHFDDTPVFAEAWFDEGIRDLNLMLELGGHWFYKAPGVECVDLMPAFFDKRSEAAGAAAKGTFDLPLHIFAPPADGENHVSAADEVSGFVLPEGDHLTNTYTKIPALPRIRIRTGGHPFTFAGKEA
ncbi:MAG: hypothetical protein K6G16_00280 [Lachnospiraceae bacterium]|nr:hypothetical protein [Lachnospiraceae bacterium]